MEFDMRHPQIVAVVVALFAISASACGGSPAPVQPTVAPASIAPAPQPPAPTPQPTEALEATAAPEANAAPEPTAASGTDAAQLEPFDPNSFGDSAVITNAWFPLKPGTRYTYEGNALRDDGALVPHRIEINVTDLTKVIGGVRSVVTWDLDYSEDTLEEAELAFYAQDKDGNVWRMGEYPEAYQDGKIAEAPAWIHGIEGAQAGISMWAQPKPGTPSYAEGWGPAVNWTDRGQVDKVGQSTCVVVDCYNDVLVVAETSLAEPDAQQLKWFARDVGNVRVGWRGAGEKSKESMELTRLDRLSPEELADVRAKALELEKSAYQNSKDVYTNTTPAEPLPPAK